MTVIDPESALPGPALRTDDDCRAPTRPVPTPPPWDVPRARLLDTVDACVRASAATLVRAPAGFGKTALLSAWARSERPPGAVAWLPLQRRDSDRERFWREIFAAVAEADARIDVAGLVASPSAPADPVLATLERILAERAEPLVLVLDDLQEIDDEGVMADLQLLLRAPPAGLRVVIGTRQDPPFRLHRLRLAGALSVIESDELLFTRDEAAELFVAGGLALHDDDVDRLWSRTEGWAAALALVTIALDGRDDPRAFIDGFAGHVWPVSEYLHEEILAEQTPGIFSFLAATSIAPEICGDLADTITGRPGSAVLLDQLHQKGILTQPVDEHREWYRYHTLLADLMRSVLRRQAPERVSVLHGRAARWYGERGHTINAARGAVSAGDVDYLGELTATRVVTVLSRGEIGELATVLRTLPEPTLRAVPSFALTLSGAAIERGDIDEAERWADLAQAGADGLPAPLRDQFDTAMAAIRLSRARAEGHLGDAIAAARVLTAEPGAGEGPEAADPDALAFVYLGALKLWTGCLDAAGTHLGRGADLATELGRDYLLVHALSHQAEHAIWSGDPIGGTRMAREALDLAERLGQTGLPFVGLARSVLSVAAMLRGRLDEAHVLLRDAESAIAASTDRPLRARITFHGARLARLRGHPDDALVAIAKVRADVVGTPFAPPIAAILETEEALALRDVGRRDEAVARLEDINAQGISGEAAVALADVRLADGDPAAALALLEPWTGTERGEQLMTTYIQAFVLVARAHRALGEREPARAALERALLLAEPQARRLPFLGHGPDLVEQLREHLSSGTAYGATIGEVQELLHGYEAGSGVLPAIEPLSLRELEVLRFLPTRLTNREIGGELFVSVNTVKTHLKQIYAKLDARDRGDAVRRARVLGLIR